MKKYLNQRGYALLIVMLTIIIFLSLSAVFMSASINHVTQEQTVDKNNQAVVAAELGVKYVESQMQNQITLLYNKNVKELRIAVNQLVNCNSNSNVNCKNQTNINALISQQIVKYKEDLNLYYQTLKTLDKDIVQNKVNYSIVDMSIAPELESTKVDEVNYYKLPFSVEGDTKLKPVILQNELLVPIPTFVSSITSKDNPIPEPNPSNSSELNKYLFTPPKTNVYCSEIMPIVEGAICKLKSTETISSVLGNSLDSINYSKITILAEDIQSSFCPSGRCVSVYPNLKVYSNKDISIDQINSLSKITLFLEGTINIDTNGNNYGGTAIVKSVNSENHFKNIKGLVFITGDNSHPIRISINKQTDAKFGKICINLDGIDIENSTFEVKNGNSKHENIYYYTSDSKRQIPDAERYIGNYKNFVNYCIGATNTPIPPLATEVTATYIEKSSNSKIIVKYNP